MQAGMDPRDTHGKIRTRGIEENDRAEGGIAWPVTGDDLASRRGKIRAGLSEIPRIERDPLIFDLFDPRGDLDRALLQFFRGEGACGTENQGIVHASNLANTHRLLLVKSRQIARRRAEKEFPRRCAGEEPEVAHHVRLIAVSGFKSDLGQAFPGIPQSARMLQTGQTGKHFWRRADRSAEMPFQRALAHSDLTGNRANGFPAFAVADELCGRLDLRRDSVLRADPAAEKVFHGQDLLPYVAGIAKHFLHTVDLLPGYDRVERRRPVVEKVDPVVEYGRGPNFREAN